MDEIVLLLKGKVNIHGELHLDAIQTAGLLKFLETASNTLNAHNEFLMGELQKLADFTRKITDDQPA